MIYALLAWIFLGINLVPRWMDGDPYRDGKLHILLASAVIPAYDWIAKRLDPFLALAYSLWIIAWCIYDSESYGFLAVIGPAVFLAAADYAARRPVAFSWLLRITVWIQLALSASNLLGFYPIEMGELIARFRGLPLGSMGNDTLLAAFLAGLLPMALLRWTLAEAVAILGCILATGSTMGIVSALVGAGAMAFKLGRRWPAYLVSSAIVFLACVALAFHPRLDFFSFSGRLPVWEIAWRYWLSRPSGWGPGSWWGLYSVWGISGPAWRQVHNEFLQILFEGGWQCLLLSIFGVARIMRRMDAVAFGGTAALLMNAAGNFPFHFPPTAFIFCFYLASAKKEARNGKSGSIRCWLKRVYAAVEQLDRAPGRAQNPRKS